MASRLLAISAGRFPAARWNAVQNDIRVGKRWFRGAVPDDMQNPEDKNLIIINYFAVGN